MYSFRNIKPLALKFNVRCFSSAFEVAGSRRDGKYTPLVPFINIDEENLSALNYSIKCRELDVDVSEIVDLWTEFKYVKEMKSKLEKNRSSISDRMKSLNKENVEEIEHLKIKGKLLRDELKNIMPVLSSLEERITLKVLKIPNYLDERVPIDSEVVLKSHLVPEHSGVDHLEFGKSLGVLDYNNCYSYFLKKAAAEFELAVCDIVNDFCIKKGFVPLSNPDFSRDIILESYGFSNDNHPALPLEKSSHETEALHLNGGASVFPFSSYLAKHSVDALPIKCVSQGRFYKNPCRVKLPGLYGVSQNTGVQISVASSKQNASNEFDEAVEMVTAVYKNLELPFRVVYTPAKDLFLSEMLRVSFQVHSPHYQKFMEVGHVSLFGDYLSKRLRMYYSGKDELTFLNLISGTIMLVQPLLAICLEFGVKKDINEFLSKCSLKK